MTSRARRALSLFVEPAEPIASGQARHPALEVAVTGLSCGCGASTVAAGLRRELPAAHITDGADAATADVLVVVAGHTALHVLASLVTDRLRERRAAVVLVANRPEDPEEWARAGAICVPRSRLGVLLLSHGRRGRGAFGAALRELADRVQSAAHGNG